MPPDRRPSRIWFRFSIGLGVVLGLVLLVQTISTYFFVYDRVVHDEAQRQAEQRQVSLQRAARMANVDDATQLSPILEELHRESPQQLAWMRVLNTQGRVLADCGYPSHDPPSTAQLLRQLESHETAASIQESPSGKLLVTLSHIRLPHGPPPLIGLPPAPPPGGPLFLEVAINMNGASLPFGGLRRNLIIGCLAAVALLVSMGMIGVLFNRYQRSRYLEQQIELARRVQDDLLPRPDSSLPSAEVLEFAAVSIPASTVGGDFYDVFRAENGQLSVVLGDVAGKGLSAALLMGVLHGAIRSMDWTHSILQHEASSERLNRLMCQKTAHERFASLFWAYVERETPTLHYINAGHLPPLLVRAGSGSPVERLEGGGPVLGMLPAATFNSGHVPIESGDLLVVYSDGIAEATNGRDEEFGEARIADVVRLHSDQSPRQICDAVLSEIGKFLGSLKPHDDQTLLVVRLSQS